MRVMYSTVTLGGCSGNLNVLLNDINRNFEGSSEFRMRLDGNRSILRVMASILNEMTGPLNVLRVPGKESTSWGTWNSQDSSVRAGTPRVKVLMAVWVIGDEERYRWDWDYKWSVWAPICVNFFDWLLIPMLFPLIPDHYHTNGRETWTFSLNLCRWSIGEIFADKDNHSDWLWNIVDWQNDTLQRFSTKARYRGACICDRSR